jgi:hypothetical protein
MEGDPMSNESIRRTRRNILAIGGILAGATFSRLGGVKTAKAQACTPSDPDDCVCFMQGTLILTPDGERKIEDLGIGDLVITGNRSAKPIEWIGWHRHRRSSGAGWVETEKPIRIAKDALGVGVPYRDLFVSQIHCLLLDGMLIEARELVNGSSIAVYPATEYEEIKYLHIKLAGHDTVYAHGALSETLRIQDARTIDMFENGFEYEQLCGSKARVAEIPCATVVSMRGGRDRLRSRVRSALSPLVDRRNAFDKIRDRLEDRAVA